MRVISLKLLREFWTKYPDAERPLRRWFKETSQSAWHNLHEARQTYPHADAVAAAGEILTVFNICGNKYRLVARIRYDYQLVNVRAVMTHREYDMGKWKE
jgi:mRNA interferase HigB